MKRYVGDTKVFAKDSITAISGMTHR